MFRGDSEKPDDSIEKVNGQLLQFTCAQLLNYKCLRESVDTTLITYKRIGFHVLYLDVAMVLKQFKISFVVNFSCL